MPSTTSNDSEETNFTIAVAEVTSSLDAMGCGRVQVAVPWLTTTRPWARVALPGAGGGRGTYAIPHPGDEVLVAFNRSDPTDCYVIGGLWNATDRPPRQSPLDPMTRLAMISEMGNELEMDDIGQTVTINTSTGATVELGPTGIKISTSQGTAAVELTQDGDLKLSALKSISLSAPSVSIEGASRVEVKSSGSVAVNGGMSCAIKATTIALN